MEEVSENLETLVLLEFSGGLDSLTLNQEKEIKLKISGKQINLGQLIAYIRKHIIGSKKDFFSFPPELTKNNSEKLKVNSNLECFGGVLNSQESCKIRPGVLVLVNDVDWELLEKEETILKNNQRVTFISTLHGG